MFVAKKPSMKQSSTRYFYSQNILSLGTLRYLFSLKKLSFLSKEKKINNYVTVSTFLFCMDYLRKKFLKNYNICCSIINE